MPAVMLAWRESRTLTMFDPIRGFGVAPPTLPEVYAD
ncbi:hypothetical protein JI435_414470 [Parastagonospora nodorum SN15]|nr:hypothetical protein JI435_414470 [Parastagonospora nodorum SN15]